MNKVECRTMIKYYFVLKNLTSTEVNNLDSTFGDSSLSFLTVNKWATEFKCSHLYISDDKYSGGLKNHYDWENYRESPQCHVK